MKKFYFLALVLFSFISLFACNHDAAKKPPVPALEKLSFSLAPGQPIDGMGLRVKELFRRVEFIAQNTPLQEIKEDFVQKIRSKEILLSFEYTGLAAAFGVFRGDQLRMHQSFNLSGIRIEPEKKYPAMNFDPQIITTLDNNDDLIRFFMIALRHEYRHYEQYLKAEPWQQAVSLPKKRSEQWTPQECEYLWQGELDANTLGCQLALDWGMPDIFDGGICRKVGTPQFQKIVFQYYALPIAERSPSCREKFKEISNTFQ